MSVVPKKQAMMAAMLAALACCAGACRASDLVLVRGGVSLASILVPADAPEPTRQAADVLAEYIEKISGARPPVEVGVPDPPPPHAVWVGVQPAMISLFPGTPLTFAHPEEILIVCDGRHLLIAGRDRTVDGTQVEFGTANAVYTFLQKYLEVRWLRPWDRAGTWTDLIERDTIAVQELAYRFQPPFLQRLFWPARTEKWDRYQRLKLGSYTFNGGHGFTDWWEKYHGDHPEWFAVQPNGTRSPPTWGGAHRPEAVKLCVANPEVWTQWLDNAEAMLRADPTRLTVSASPNDGGGFCVCTNCLAWDHPDGPVAGADRYVKFWNILARGLKERFPDREAWVGAYAYSAYKAPPIAETLEKNIAIGYVGHFPLANDTVTDREKAAWTAWASKASCMVYRPNLFHYSGGFLGLPTVAMRRTIRDFRFLAERNCRGLQVDSLPHSFTTQGVQYYLMAQLAYDPYQDGEALLTDYYRRAFGPAARDIAAYFDLMEGAHETIINWEGFRHSSGRAKELVDICRQVYTSELLATAEKRMQSAVAKVAEGPERYKPRVESIRKGVDFAKLQVQIMRVMKQVRDSGGTDKAAVEKATALCLQRDEMIEAGEGRFPEWYHKRVLDHMGPPSGDFQKSAHEGPVQYMPAIWKEAWSDDFERTELGPDWRVLQGNWAVQNGQLITMGGSLVSSRTFSGLHRLEFQASVRPNPGISDLSPAIHCGPAGYSSGYLLQFGGYNNSKNSVQRKGSILVENGDFRIEAGKVHTITAEYDGGKVRLTVDGRTAMECADPQPLVGPDHEQIGFYVYEGRVKIGNVRVYTARAVKVKALPDEGIGFE